MSSPAAVSAKTISTILDEYKASVSRFINEEVPERGVSNLNSNISAGRDVNMALQNASVAYEDSQNCLPGVDTVAKKQLEILGNMVADLQTKNPAKNEGLAFRVHSFIQSLSLGDFLADVSPRYVHVERKQRFTVSFMGSFSYAAKSNSAELVIKDYIFKPTTSKADCLTFDVEFPPDYLNNIDTFNLIKRELKIPSGASGLLSSSVKNRRYEVYIGIHPLSPGKISLTYYQQVVAGLAERTRSLTLGFDQSGTESIEQQLTISPALGWKFSAAPQLHFQDAAINVPDEQCTANKVSVILKLPQGEGRFEARVELKESKQVMEEKPFTPDLQLGWDEGVTFAATKFNLKFTGHDGKEFECTEPTDTNPHLRIFQTVDGSYRLVTLLPK
ncbi:MAG: hypothetical protein ABSA17_00120 [Rhabdochlamydiaceae bacterium]